jgi:hypothetical protein
MARKPSEYGLTEESRSLRASRIGTSELGAIAGIHPFVSPFQVWERIVLGAERPQLERMAMGAALEGRVAEIWAERSGERIRRNRHTRTRGILASTADAYIIGKRALLEVKVTGAVGIWGSGLPEFVRFQAIGQSIVYRVPRVVVVALIAGVRLAEFEVIPTRAERRGIREMAEAFWTAHIDTAEIPLPMFPSDLAPYLRLLQGTKPEERRPATDREQELGTVFQVRRADYYEAKAAYDGTRGQLIDEIAKDPRRLVVGDGWSYAQDPETGRIVVHTQGRKEANGEAA